jgi:hypothetical protein
VAGAAFAGLNDERFRPAASVRMGLCAPSAYVLVIATSCHMSIAPSFQTWSLLPSIKAEIGFSIHAVEVRCSIFGST